MERRPSILLPAVLCLIGCSGVSVHGPSSTTGGSSGTTAASSTSSTTSGGSTSGATSTSGSSTGGAFGGCTDGFAFVNGACLATACATGLLNDPCVLGDGGVGFCGGGTCLSGNPQTDPANCGGFGNLCPADTSCVAGQCLTDGGTPSACGAGACPPGSLCGDICLQPLAACGANSDSLACETGTEAGLCCGGQCLSLQSFFESSDSNNCGGCGLVCPSGSACAQGTCWATACALGDPPMTGCLLPSGIIGECCTGSCIDVSTDPQNCGGCGLSCPVASPSCTPDGCYDPCQSAADCAPGDGCLDGQCYPASCAGEPDETYCLLTSASGGAARGTCCDSMCVGSDDPANCGVCGSVCPTGQTCLQGECLGEQLDCTGSPNGALCFDGGLAGTCCDHACLLGDGDDQDCGACGLACPDGSHCTPTSFGAACMSGGSTTGLCDAGCPSGTVCDPRAQLCVPATCTGPATEGDLCLLDGGAGQCCDEKCVDTSSDPSNCGACRVQCGAGSRCALDDVTGTILCQSADGGPIGPCHDVICPAGQACMPGLRSCAPTSCTGIDDGEPCAFGGTAFSFQTGEGMCCDGDCIDPTQDPGNCGYCGIACAAGACPLLSPLLNAGSGGCPPVANPSKSSCVVSCAPGSFCLDYTCEPSFCKLVGTVCGTPAGRAGICCGFGSACIDVASDPQNCGGCGLACAASQTCNDGVCGGLASPCDAPGRIGAFCDLDAGTGSVCCPGVGCIDLQTDSSNCGVCGQACQAPETCQAGTCA